MAKNPTLTLRKMEIDFTHARVHWNPEAPEYCQLWNAFSAGIPALERFLIKVMRKAKAAMPQTADPDLVRDIDMFIGQEGQHYRLHEQFNKLLYAEGWRPSSRPWPSWRPITTTSSSTRA